MSIPSDSSSSIQYTIKQLLEYKQQIVNESLPKSSTDVAPSSLSWASSLLKSIIHSSRPVLFGPAFRDRVTNMTQTLANLIKSSKPTDKKNAEQLMKGVDPEDMREALAIIGTLNQGADYQLDQTQLDTMLQDVQTISAFLEALPKKEELSDREEDFFMIDSSDQSSKSDELETAATQQQGTKATGLESLKSLGNAESLRNLKNWGTKFFTRSPSFDPEKVKQELIKTSEKAEYGELSPEEINSYKNGMNKLVGDSLKGLTIDPENSKEQFRSVAISEDIRQFSEVQFKTGTNETTDVIRLEENLPGQVIVSTGLDVDIGRTSVFGLNGKVIVKKGSSKDDPSIPYTTNDPMSRASTYKKIFQALQSTVEGKGTTPLSENEQELLVRRSFMNLSMFLTQGSSSHQFKIIKKTTDEFSDLGLCITGKGALIDLTIDKDQVSIAIVNLTKLFTPFIEEEKQGKKERLTFGYVAHKVIYTISREELAQTLTTINLDQLKELLPASIRDKPVSSMTSEEIGLLLKQEKTLFKLEAEPLNSKRIEQEKKISDDLFGLQNQSLNEVNRIQKEKELTQSMATSGTFAIKGTEIAKAFDLINNAPSGDLQPIEDIETTLNLANIFPSLKLEQSFSAIYSTQNEALSSTGLKADYFPIDKD